MTDRQTNRQTDIDIETKADIQTGKGGHQMVEHFVTKPCCNYKDFHEICSSHMKCKYNQTAMELVSNIVKCYGIPVTLLYTK